MFTSTLVPCVRDQYCMARKGGLIGATLRSGYLASRSTVLEAERLLLQAVTWRHSMKRVLSEPFDCVGSGTASSASRYYRRGNVCDQFFAKFNDTKWVHNREPRSVTSLSLIFLCFVSSPGPAYNTDSAAHFIQTMFLHQIHNQTKVVYPHFTTATDTSNIQVVFQVVMDTIIKDNIAAVQLL